MLEFRRSATAPSARSEILAPHEVWRGDYNIGISEVEQVDGERVSMAKVEWFVGRTARLETL
jgi:hypothetical protein